MNRPLTGDELVLARDIGRFSANPLGFVRYAYPWRKPGGELAEYDGPRVWQAEVLETIGQHLRGPNRFDPLLYAISSGHGVGKSALIAMINNWAMSTCEDCRVAITANTEPQLRTKTWPEVSKWTRLSINAHWWNVTATTVSVRAMAHERMWRTDAIAWSENNTEAFAGLHNKGKRIVVIFDEGSAIADSIYEVTEGALTDEDTEIIWLAFGNPTRNIGRFRECFGRYKHRWITKQIDSRTIDGTNKEQIDKWISDYGEDSDFCRVRVRGEFPRAGSAQFISNDVVSRARHRTLPAEGFKILSVDVARYGSDQTVMGIRQGQNLRIVAKLRGLDLMQVAHRVMEVIRKERPRTTIIDGDGIGAGVVDCIRHEMKDWYQANPRERLHEFHGGAGPANSSMYFNRRAEAWGMMRDWLREADIPDDPELESDLIGPEYFFSGKNQIQLEKKEDMKKRGLSSPDCADMLAMSCSVMPMARAYDEMSIEDAAITAEANRRWMEDRGRESNAWNWQD